MDEALRKIIEDINANAKKENKKDLNLLKSLNGQIKKAPIKIENSKLRKKITDSVIHISSALLFLGRLNDLVKLVQKLDPILGKYIEILERYKLIPGSEYDLNFMMKMVEVYDKDQSERRKSITRLYLNNYDKVYFTQLKERWNNTPQIRSRIHVLNEAVDAHLMKMFNLSTPIILSQTEGILSEWFVLPDTGRYNALKDIVQLWNGTENIYDALVSDFIVDDILTGFIEGESVKANMSRHAILHGYDIKYGTEINSIRSILVLDYIISKTKYISIEDETIYHKIGCTKLHNSYKANGWGGTRYEKKNNKKLFRYNSEKEAMDAGKEPCEICCLEKGY